MAADENEVGNIRQIIEVTMSRVIHTDMHGHVFIHKPLNAPKPCGADTCHAVATLTHCQRDDGSIHELLLPARPELARWLVTADTGCVLRESASQRHTMLTKGSASA